MCLQCRREPETVIHYLLECPKYAGSRDEMLRVLWPTVDKFDLDINNKLIISRLQLEGHENLTKEENIDVFRIVQKYIKATGRF